jgi:hypothetical protein
VLNKRVGRELQCLVKRVPSMYSVGIFIGNQVGGCALLSTIMPRLPALAQNISPWGHYNEVKYRLNKYTTKPTLGRAYK